MKQILRNIHLILLAFLLAIISIGFSVSEVYCYHKKQNEYAISFFSNGTSITSCSCKKHEEKKKVPCCSKSKKKSKKKKCCDSQSVKIVLDDVYEYQKEHFSGNNGDVWIDVSLPVLTFNTFENVEKVEDCNLRPPPLLERDIQVLFQTYLI